MHTPFQGYAITRVRWPRGRAGCEAPTTEQHRDIIIIQPWQSKSTLFLRFLGILCVPGFSCIRWHDCPAFQDGTDRQLFLEASMPQNDLAPRCRGLAFTSPPWCAASQPCLAPRRSTETAIYLLGCGSGQWPAVRKHWDRLPHCQSSDPSLPHTARSRPPTAACACAWARHRRPSRPQPIDRVKTIMMTQSLANPEFGNALEALRAVLRHEGARACHVCPQRATCSNDSLPIAAFVCLCASLEDAHTRVLPRRRPGFHTAPPPRMRIRRRARHVPRLRAHAAAHLRWAGRRAVGL